MSAAELTARARALHEAGRPAEAEPLYRAALAQRPDDHEALGLLGLALHELGRSAEGEPLVRRAVALAPCDPVHHHNLGVVLTALRRPDEALDAYQAAIRLEPRLAPSLHNAGILLQDAGRLDEAVAAYRAAVVADLENLGAQNNLGTALRALGRLEEAVAAYRAVLAADPAVVEAWLNLTLAHVERREFDEAERCLETALRLRPQMAALHATRARIAIGRGRLAEVFPAFRRALELDPTDAAVHSELILMLEFDPAQDGRAIAAEQRRWNALHGPPADSAARPAAGVRASRAADLSRRLRVGYLSADFREHPVGRHVLPLVCLHDRDRFEVFCYSNSARVDAVTAAFRAAAEYWRPVVGVGDDALAAQIGRDQIDVLVDLSLHTNDNRLPLLARRPAPVQLSFAGYPGSTGVAAIDYRLTDRWLEPPGRAPRDNERASTELPLYLDGPFWCYQVQPGEESIEPGPLPALAAGHVTFGSLVHVCKINAGVLDQWAAALRAVAESRMVILAPAGEPRTRIAGALAQRGVAPERIEFLAFMRRPAYLQAYRRIDVVLDTSPYNGHTTTIESLWMGVPVVTLEGDRPVARGGLSILTSAGLPELVAAGSDQFTAIAARLANDLTALAALRASLRPRLEASPLMDAQRFTRDVERALGSAWCGDVTG